MTEHDITTLAGWLKEMRTRHGWTQEELAARLAVARHTIARWETGVNSPMPIFRKILTHVAADVGLPPIPKE